MPTRRARWLVLAAMTQALLCAGAAFASGWAGSNPGSNYRAAPLPASCFVHPTGATCINAGVYYLDKARARLHQRAYKLPANFVKLSPAQQAFILTNLDRIQYRLPPIGGLTTALNQIAMGGQSGNPGGVLGDNDPLIPGGGLATTSNWASGYPNIVLAYEAWMYDDGFGSGNIDCTTPSSSGCWGHRHDVLWKFPSGRTAMGAAAGKDRRRVPGYAMILAEGHTHYTSSYTYTWKQARADGAGKHSYKVSRPGGTSGTMKIKSLTLNPTRTAILVSISAPSGLPLKCSLSRQVAGSWVLKVPLKSCGRSDTFPIAGPGSYEVNVKSAIGTASETISFS